MKHHFYHFFRIRNRDRLLGGLLKPLTLGLYLAQLEACSSSNRDSKTPAVIKPSSKKPGDFNDKNDSNVIREGVLKTSVEKEDSPNRPAPLTTDAAIQYFVTECSGCHGPGKAMHASWPFPETAKVNLNYFETDVNMARVYQVLSNKVGSASETAYPAPMPPRSLSPEDTSKIKRLLSWMEDNLKTAVHEANIRFSTKSQISSALQIDFNFKCNKTVTGKEFLTRFAADALGRVPTDQELATYVPAAEQDAPVSLATRQALTQKLLVDTDPFQAEFLNAGLEEFAKNVAGVGSFKEGGSVNAARLADLKSEFYELLKRQILQKSYKEILLSNTVMVTTRTAPLYENCTFTQGVAGDPWASCTLSPKRSNYFGTVGFLLSKPSSFLLSNNNYGRGGEAYAFLSGEKLMANTDGPKGEPPRPIPSCLSTKDHRWKLPDLPSKIDATKPENRAPWGAISVPAHGRVCQSCHLNRNLAAGSFVYRPFGMFGELISPAAVMADDPKVPLAQNGRKGPYRDDLTAAVIPTNVDVAGTTVTPLTAQYFADLLKENDDESAYYACGQNPDGSTKMVRTLADFIEITIGDGSILTRGLTRYIPISISGSNSTNLEISTAVSKAYTSGGGKLLPVFKGYFDTDTYACKKD